MGLLVHSHRAQNQHEVAERELRIITALPNSEVLADFDTIRKLTQAPPPDDQLLAILE
jgi:hypothetical protein